MKFARAATAAFLLVSGCATRESIPRYPLVGAGELLKAVGAASEKVQTITADSTITLTRPDGASIVLDGAIVMRPPDHARIRAWKFGRAIFDLTLTPEGLWLITPEDPNRKSQFDAAGASAGELARVWSLLTGRYFREPLTVVSENASTLVTRRQVPNEPTVLCEIDRPTLTPRKYQLLDEHDVVRFSLLLDRYKSIGDTVWPMRMKAISGASDIVIEHRTVELNTALADAAFKPPSRAEKLP